MKNLIKLGISLALILIVIGIIVSATGISAIETALLKLSLPSIVAAIILLGAGFILSALRLKLIATSLGYPLSLRNALITLSVGQLAGTLLFQFFGQLIGRAAVLSRQGISPAATVVISGYERVTATIASLTLAGAGGIYLFGKLNININGGGLSLIRLMLGLSLAAAAGAIWAWGRPVANMLRHVTRQHLKEALLNLSVALGIQLTTLAAYVTFGHTLAPNIDIVSLAAASCIVMLAASLPISLGGWGLRELSAVVALQTIGLSSASALLVALLVGVLSLAVTVLAAILALSVTERPEAPRGHAAAERPTDYTALLDWSLPLVAVTAVFFQIYLPTGKTLLSINLADPVVLVGAGLFMLQYLGNAWPKWRLRHALAYVFATSLVIGAAFVAGWISFGWTPWAFANRLLGWPMLLSYSMTGALIVNRGGEQGFELLLRTFAATGAAIIFLDVSMSTLSQAGIRALDTFVNPQISGFSQNSNAFAFLLLLVLAAIFVMQTRTPFRVGLMSMTMAGLVLSGSRTGLLVLPVMITAAAMLGMNLRILLLPAAIAGAIVAGFVLIPVASQTVGVEMAHPTLDFSSADSTDTMAASVQQHWRSITDGLEMFYAHPLLGSGMGAYMNKQIVPGGSPSVIHSTPIWLLAETGIIGFTIFFAAACRLFLLGVRNHGEPWGRLLVLILCILAVMSFIHELLYQRAFWILLGAVLATKTYREPIGEKPAPPISLARA